MIIDSSAVIAVLKREPEHEAISAILAGFAKEIYMSVANYLESMIVLEHFGNPMLVRQFDVMIRTIPIILEPVSLSQSLIAVDANRDFGKGRRNLAKLNYGDCFCYALAYEKGEPILCVGNDFMNTDIKVVPLSSQPEG